MKMVDIVCEQCKISMVYLGRKDDVKVCVRCRMCNKEGCVDIRGKEGVVYV